MMIRASEIRKQFPNPTPSHPEVMALGPLHRDQYCVGGALCRTIAQEGVHFPNYGVLTYALIEANPALSVRQAEQYARRIIRANDVDRDIEAAWAILDDALTYVPFVRLIPEPLAEPALVSA